MSSGAQTVATGCLEYRHLRPQLHGGVTENIPDTEAELSLRGDMPIGPD
jgi:hypothetical protein